MPATRTNHDDSHDRAAAHRISAAVLIACVFVFSLAVTGCYDGAKLVDEARSTAQRTRLAEVDLGEYKTTMPKDPDKKLLANVELHLFGTVPRYRVPTVERQLVAEDFRLRHEMLAAIREASPAELAEPSWAQFRLRLEKVVNEILKDAPVDEVGFYDIRVVYR